MDGKNRRAETDEWENRVWDKYYRIFARHRATALYILISVWMRAVKYYINIKIQRSDLLSRST